MFVWFGFLLFFSSPLKLSRLGGREREEENENTRMCQGALKSTFLSQSPDEKFLMPSPHSTEVPGSTFFVVLHFSIVNGCDP